MFLHYQQGLEAVQPTWKLFSEQLGIHIRPPTVRCLFFAKVVELLILDIPKPIFNYGHQGEKMCHLPVFYGKLLGMESHSTRQTAWCFSAVNLGQYLGGCIVKSCHVTIVMGCSSSSTKSPSRSFSSRIPLYFHDCGRSGAMLSIWTGLKHGTMLFRHELNRHWPWYHFYIHAVCELQYAFESTFYT